MNVVIFGRSCTGKTSIARRLAELCKLPARYCGDTVRAAAALASVPVDDLPLAEHRRIDDETRSWVAQSGSAIVEGRYLQFVLASCARDSLIVETRCADTIRAVRWSERGGATVDVDALRSMDDAEDRFVAAFYGSGLRISPHLVIDTTHLSETESASMIVEEWHKRIGT